MAEKLWVFNKIIIILTFQKILPHKLKYVSDMHLQWDICKRTNTFSKQNKIRKYNSNFTISLKQFLKFIFKTFWKLNHPPRILFFRLSLYQDVSSFFFLLSCHCIKFLLNCPLFSLIYFCFCSATICLHKSSDIATQTVLGQTSDSEISETKTKIILRDIKLNYL